MPTLNPDILRWARSTAGLSLEEAAHAIELHDAHGVSGPERLAVLEAGKEEPSRPLLLRMAKAYRRSLLVFYLENEPKTGDRGKDFKRLPNGAAPQYNPVLDALIRDIKGRQSLIKSLLEDAEAGALTFIGSAKPETPVAELAGRITRQLQFDLSTFRVQKTIEEAFAYLRQKAEVSRIFVLLIGNLGSHHTNISVETFRGLALADAHGAGIALATNIVKTRKAIVPRMTKWYGMPQQEVPRNGHSWLHISVSTKKAHRDLHRLRIVNL